MVESNTFDDNSHLFRHLKIWQAGKEYTQQQGKFPVISLTFKDAKTTQWEECLRYLKNIIRKEYKRHDYLLRDKSLTDDEKIDFNRIIHYGSRKR